MFFKITPQEDLGMIGKQATLVHLARSNDSGSGAMESASGHGIAGAAIAGAARAQRRPWGNAGRS